MKIQLIDARPGVMKSIVLKEWMRIALSICLLGLPVILGYFSIQIVEARNTEIAKDSPASALSSEFDFSETSATASAKIASSQTLPPPRSAPPSAPAASNPSEVNIALELRIRHQYEPQHQQTADTGAQPSPIFVSYGDMLTSGRLIAGIAYTYFLSESFIGFTPHKNGRLIDPASYIRSTIR